MRQSLAAFALIRRENASGALWLAQWNGNWNRFNFVGGHKRSHESFRECVIREVAEELEIVAGPDCVVSEHPLAHLEYVAWSRSANEETAYSVELFDVRLVNGEAAHRVDAQPANRWLTESEIAAQKSSDGLEVSETMSLLLTKAGLWSLVAQSSSDQVQQSLNEEKGKP